MKTNYYPSNWKPRPKPAKSWRDRETERNAIAVASDFTPVIRDNGVISCVAGRYHSYLEGRCQFCEAWKKDVTESVRKAAAARSHAVTVGRKVKA